ncbi:oligopeptide/dipeptide ABC transporter ATP-binding protein [Paenochrobactrum sp. BZR 588]|uniref:oligopeptide/dipeptide ABC transporter ATP-binding protein n=1 Tax=unclassified Paenochrobactrum TaxID=2639760 RepID=UPI003855238E
MERNNVQTSIVAWIVGRQPLHLFTIHVERASRENLFNAPQHPYTRLLLAAVPSINNIDRVDKQAPSLAGEVPSPLNMPSGCPFQTRCAYVRPKCKTNIPVLGKWHENHAVACHYAGQLGI